MHSDNITTTKASIESYRNMNADNFKSEKYTFSIGKDLGFRVWKEPHPLFMSELALEIYSVFLLFILTRKYWMLHGITLVIIAHIGDVLFAWYMHVKKAREILLFKSWLVWWIRIGLDFASTTMDMDVMHLVVANTLTFWNWIGKKYAVNWFNDHYHKRRALVLNRAKEQVDQLTENHNHFGAGLRDALKRNPD